jgi:hypothetical protein
MAPRIRARAIRRCGELLKQIPAKPGKRTDLEPQDPEGLGLSPRSEMAGQAGMSPKQAKTALQVAAVPHSQFEALVEGKDPLTVKALAEIGRQKRKRPLINLGERTPKEFAAATRLMGR